MTHAKHALAIAFLAILSLVFVINMRAEAGGNNGTVCDIPGGPDVIVGDVRGSHFMMCIENVAYKNTKELFAPEVEIGSRIARHCQQRGLIVRPIAHLNVMSPPLILDRGQIDEMIGILRGSIEATMDELVRENLWHG